MTREITYSDKPCAVCGAVFSPANGRQKYCSTACKNGEAKCEGCDAAFVPKGRHSSKRFCSLACWYKSMRKDLDRTCDSCGQVFRAVRGPTQRFCSTECKDKGLRSPTRNTHCEKCGEPLRRNCAPTVRFCSRTCARSAGNGRQKPWPEGSKRMTREGYVMIKVGSEWPLEHRVVMERILGRPLARGENVHHRNGDRSDNRPENLELWRKKQPYGQRVSDLMADFRTQPEIAVLPEGQRDSICAALERVLVAKDARPAHAAATLPEAKASGARRPSEDEQLSIVLDLMKPN